MISVPPVKYETHKWVAHNDGMTSQTKLRNATGKYQSSIPSEIAKLDFHIAANLAADIEEATSELTRFDSHAAATLGPASRALGPMSSILLRTESTSSSQIENLTVGARQLALAEIEQSISVNAKTVVGNVKAMEAALALADDIDESAILHIHAELVSRQQGWEKYAGKYREELVWIGHTAVSPIGAAFVACQSEYVPGAMHDLVEFMTRIDLPAIIQAAIAHAQFETIHPFADGNGRTGRAIVHSLLRYRNIVTSTTAPVSAGLLKQTGQYFDSLRSYREGDATPIVERFVSASLFAAWSGTKLVDSLAEQLELSKQKMVGLTARSSAWTVLPYLVSQPVINSSALIKHFGMNEMAAQRALNSLSECGVLEEKTGKQRNRVWQHSGILAVLDDYAESLRRQ